MLLERLCTRGLVTFREVSKLKTAMAFLRTARTVCHDSKLERRLKTRGQTMVELPYSKHASVSAYDDTIV